MTDGENRAPLSSVKLRIVHKWRMGTSNNNSRFRRVAEQVAPKYSIATLHADPACLGALSSSQFVKRSFVRFKLF